MKKNDSPDFEDAVEAYEAGDAELALDILDGLLPDDPAEADLEGLYLAAECLLDLQEPQEAAHLLELALEQEPGEPNLLHSYGVALFELGRLDEAQSRFEAAAKQEPRLGEAWVYLGILAERDGDDDAARALWRKGVKADPENLTMPASWSAGDVRAAWADVLDEVPEPLAGWWRALKVIVKDLPTGRQIEGDGDPISPLVHCIFEGGERSVAEGDAPEGWFQGSPDRVLLFRKNLQKSGPDEESLREEIGEAVLWETIEFLGLDDAQMEALGLLGEDDEDDEE